MYNFFNKDFLSKTLKNVYLLNIKVEHAHLEGQAPRSERSRGGRSADDPQDEATAAPHPATERLDGAEPAGGGERVAGEEVRATEEAEDERHDGVGDLLSAGGVDMDEAETEVGGEGGVDGAVGGAEAEDELVGAEAALGGAWEVGEGVEEDGGGGLDLSVGKAGERDVFDCGDASEGLLLEGAVLDAVEGDDQGKGRRRRVAAVVHCHRGSEPCAAHRRRGFESFFRSPTVTLV